MFYLGFREVRSPPPPPPPPILKHGGGRRFLKLLFRYTMKNAVLLAWCAHSAFFDVLAHVWSVFSPFSLCSCLVDSCCRHENEWMRNTGKQNIDRVRSAPKQAKLTTKIYQKKPSEVSQKHFGSLHLPTFRPHHFRFLPTKNEGYPSPHLRWAVGWHSPKTSAHPFVKERER